MVTPVTFKLTRWPSIPSNRIIAILLAVPIVMILVSPNAIRAATSISPDVKSAGGMKKSAVLIAMPEGVATEMRPDAPPKGTLVTMLVGLTVPFAALVMLNLTLSFVAVVSKSVPLIVTEEPGAPIVGVNPVIVGAPL